MNYATDPVQFIDDYIQRNELGQPFSLMPHQREVLSAAFAFDSDGRLPWDTIVISDVKKSGKTTLNGGVTTWWGFTQEPPNLCLVAANDLEQAQSRVFKTIGDLLTNNPLLGRSVVNRTKVGITLSNGTTVGPISGSDFAGEAGANCGFTSWDELWGFTSEASRRLWEELTPVPTRRNSVRFVTTYAGIEDESELLQQLYQLGVGSNEHVLGQAERIHAELPIYVNRAARLFCYWNHEPRMPWQTRQYYDAQRRVLRPGTFLRLHENRWTSAEDRFIAPETLDACTDHAYRPPRSVPTGVVVGVDASVRSDCTAVVAVTWDGDRLAVVAHRIWRPTKQDPMDLEATVERYLRELHARFTLAVIVADPFQLHRSITTLKTAGLPIQEFPQTQSNLTAAGQGLWELLNGRNLKLYPADDLREHLGNAVAIETSRGWRISKDTPGRKVDGAVALAMACRAALDLDRRPKGATIAAILPDSSTVSGPGAGSWREAFFKR
jgi:phage terminase large subunit-like protein